MRLSFYPSYFVTPRIFKAIQGYIRFVNKKYMIIGKQGISKSMGFLLAWHLCSVSAALHFHHQDAAKKLIELKLLNPQPLKIFYVSFR